MAIPQIFMQISAARERGDLKTVRRLFKSVEKGYGDNSYFLFEKGMFELLNGANKKTVVLPLFEKAYRCGLNENFDFLFRFGMLLYELGIYATSAEVLGKAIAIKPDHVGVLGYLACVFEKTGNPVTATNTYKIALKIEPRNISINFNIAGTLMVCGYQEEALEAYKKAVECIKEDSLRLTNAYNYSNYLFYSNYVEMNRDEYFALCQKYRTIWENEIPNIRPIFPETEKIKIGFVSGDFYFMAVSFFVSSLFENYDKNKFEFHLFSTLAREKYDKNTKMFMEQTDKWHDIAKLNVNDVVNLIKKEKITVLVDLSGHTGGNGLLIFGRRPAPIQINYCGYPNTTGLKSIDYRITDNVCEPDDAQNYHSEKLFKMDECFLCYQAHRTMDVECVFESLQNRPIVFGSFNNLSKMTKKTIELWCNVVNAVPNSKLVIKNKLLNDPKLREIMLSRFVENGLCADRITIFDFNFDNKEHILQYNKIDIALDSFPYNGTTTTCEALYMGVPVITILGDRHVSRVSASLLNAVGLSGLIAKDEKDFVKIAADLAGNPERLTEIKKNLRENMIKSPLMDKKSFTERWQNAILKMIDEVKKEEV